MQQRNWLIFYVLNIEIAKIMDITIIVPFYNGNKYIDNIINMVSNNVNKLEVDISVELLIVNDSPWIEVKMTSKPNGYEVRILNFEDNVGIQGARVRGIKNARGTFIHMLDQDDTIEDEFLKKTYAKAKTSDVVVSDGWRRLPNGDKPIYLTSSRQEKVKKLFYYVYIENRILSPGHCLIRRNAIPDEWLRSMQKKNGADDLVLWILMLCKKARFSIVPEKLYNHIDTGENVSGDDMKMAESTLEACDILNSIKYVPGWIPFMLRRKTQNDIYYITHNKDKYIDYRIIELLRKLKGGYRS